MTIGRPPIGPKVSVFLPEVIIEHLDEEAEEREMKRSELIRLYVTQGLQRAGRFD